MEQKNTLRIIRGSVHNILWEPMCVNVRITLDGGQVYERKCNVKGYFNIPFPCSTDKTIKVKAGLYNLSDGSLIFEREVECKSQATWANFTEEKTKDGVTYNGICRGRSEFERLYDELEKEYGPEQLSNMLVSSSIDGLSEKAAMLVVAYNIASIARTYCGGYGTALTDEDVIYGLARTGLLELGKLRSGDDLAQNAIEMMFFEPTLRVTTAFNEAKKSNIIRRSSQLDQEVWSRIASMMNVVMLRKHFLEDGACLADILESAQVKDYEMEAVGRIFRDCRALSDTFFARLKESGALSSNKYNRFVRACAIGHIVLHKVSCITAALDKLGDKYLGEMAKWSSSEWAGIGLDETQTAKALSRIEQTYPNEAFIAKLHSLAPDDKVISLLYDDLMFRSDDASRLDLSDFASVNGFSFAGTELEGLDIKREVLSLRRIYLLTDNAPAALVLWQGNMRSAVTIRHKFNRSRFITYMRKAGIPITVSRRIYSNVEKQYIRIVSFYKDYRDSSLMDNTGDKPANIKNLFGSQDAYNYSKSMSLLGQSAYYADLLRFLGKMHTSDEDKSAYDIIIARRPDLQYINLESRNSETLIPYIDLVCEILERKIMEWTGGTADYSKYNTLHESNRLAAVPQNVERSVYRTINEAHYPVTSAGFSLYQEEIRAYLEAIGCHRYAIMEKYGADEIQIAAEYFAFSAAELSSLSSTGQVLEQWGLNTADASIPVHDFMRKTGLDYSGTVVLTGLFGFKLMGADMGNKGYPDVDKQFITLDAGAEQSLDLMRRFVLLWKHVGWDMDKLYSFIAEQAEGRIDSSTLVLLYKHISNSNTNEDTTEDVTDTLLTEDIRKALSAIGNFDEEEALSGKLFAFLQEYWGEKWMEKMADVYNPVREKKRDALVAFALESCRRKAFSGVPDWKDSSDIFDELLVDVMMNSRMQTSRIKQATGSVQLFVQRCLLNLEPSIRISAASLADNTSSDTWSQWSWMKNYRVWEANRKIFLFPENWIEEELRDDQTPFFKEFLDTIDQTEATSENLSDAILEYLYKLDEVAHLEVCNIYRQIDKEANVDVLHVIAHTKSSPAVWYYRSCNLLTDVWSAWEKVEVDIASDQVTLAIYRGKLHLFWLNYTQKALKPTSLPSDDDKSVSSREALKYYEIQLSWSVRKSGGWSSKTTSKKKLIHPWERPQYSYDLKSYLDSDGKLHLDVYLSTSPEFNNIKVSGEKSANPEFKCRYSNTEYNETYKPWHSSTFLFEGYVTEVYMRNMGAPGNLSMDFIGKYFGEDGRAIRKLGWKMTGPALFLPEGMHLKNNRLVNNSKSTRLFVGEDLSKSTYNSRELLGKAGDDFQMVLTQQTVQMDALQKGAMLFFQDNNRAYSIRTSGLYEYRFKSFYHPFASRFISDFNRDGIDGLLNNGEQTLAGNDSFCKIYKPSSANVSKVYPAEEVDFSKDGAYGIYNWELFFHIPLTIACRLSGSFKYEEALKWFHYIFNPMEYVAGQTPKCYWVTEPFRRNSSERVETLLKNITDNADLLAAWRNNPFKPHIIAQFRTDVYQKLVVRKYIENLINWADDLFRQDTWETINEAMMLYLMAAEILGDRPEKVQDDMRSSGASITNFKGLQESLDQFGNSTSKVSVAADAMLAMENLADLEGFRGNDQDNITTSSSIPSMDVFYFNVPSNDTLVGYWDTVEDRIFKIRNSMNIDGIVRTLSLNAPEIDPAALVKAAAAGMSIDAAEFGGDYSRPRYRFRYYLGKAIEICNETRSMGDKLLTAIEKEDSAALSELRSELEVKALEAVTRNKELEIQSVKDSIASLEISKSRSETVLDYYENIEHLSTNESKALQLSSSQISGMMQVAILNQEASCVGMLPSVCVGTQGVFSSPVVQGDIFSGQALASILNAEAGIITAKNSIAQQKGGILATKASYERRSDEWRLQAKTAKKDLESIESQLTGLQTKLEIAERDLENHKASIQNSDAVYKLLCSQYSGKKLYSWIKKESASIYRKMFELAFSCAKKAELCYAFELGDNAPSSAHFIDAASWNSDHAGLMAGDILMSQLRSMEQSYTDNDKSCFELTKHISLATLGDAISGGSALVKLLKEGFCVIDLPEWLYDLDYPTHGNRRIKNVSITIPCVVGPNTNVNCTLTLLKEVRRSRNDAGKALSLAKASELPEAERPSIATSTAVNDSGLFEVQFGGDKYLPFEGYGAVSRWMVSIPAETNHFDRSSISDVLLNITYYAQEYGNHDQEKRNFVRVVSARHEFPDIWHRCSVEKSAMELKLEPAMLHNYMRGDLKSFELAAVVELTKSDDGTVVYGDVAGEYSKEENSIVIKNAGTMMERGIEDILIVLTCNA